MGIHEMMPVVISIHIYLKTKHSVNMSIKLLLEPRNTSLDYSRIHAIGSFGASSLTDHCHCLQ